MYIARELVILAISLFVACVFISLSTLFIAYVVQLIQG